MAGVKLLDFGIAVVLLLACGYAVLRLITPHAAFYWFERWAFAFVVGNGMLSLIWVLLMPLYGVVPPVIVLSLIVGGLFLKRGRARKGVRPLFEEKSSQKGAVPLFYSDPVLLAGAVVLTVEFAVLFATAMHTSLGWDGLFNFEMKARLAFDHQPRGQMPIAYFSDRSRAWSHPRYPLVLPFAEFWIYSWLGRVDQVVIKALFPLFFMALVAFACGVMRRLVNGRVALVCGIALGLLPALTVGPGAVTGNADVPLAASIMGAVGAGTFALATGERRAFYLAAVLGAVAAWTKAEGLMLALCFGAGVIGSKMWMRRKSVMSHGSLSAAWSLLWIPLAVSVPWILMQLRYGMPESDFPSLSPSVLMLHLDRLPGIVALIARELMRPGHWGLVWPAFAIAFSLMVWRQEWTATDVALSAVVTIPLALYSIVFLFSSWPNISEHVATSIERLLIPLIPIAMIFAVSRLWKDVSSAPLRLRVERQ